MAALTQGNDSAKPRWRAIFVGCGRAGRAALEQVAADVAFISSPSSEHAAQFLACAARGLHVWIEKPVALTVADAQAMQRAAEQGGIQVATPYLAERHPALAEAVARCRRGELGRLIQLTALRTRRRRGRAPAC